MKLLEPASIGGMPVKNRVIMAPMTRSRCDNPEFLTTELHVEYYKQRAGAGLIITEGTVVSPQGRGYINTPGIYSERQTAAWKNVTEAVHQEGGKIFIQIWHVGRISHPDFQDGKLPAAPSAVNPKQKVFTSKGLTDTQTPKALRGDEIKQIVNDFKKAGENAAKAGFDGVEIHSSNGYLFHQFFSSQSNKRTDKYGNSIENKARFFFEVIDALKEVMPENKIGVRLNPMMHGMQGIDVDENTVPVFDYVIKRLNDYTLAYLHLSRPVKVLNEPYFIQDVIGRYRKMYKGFLIANWNYDKDSAEKELAEGRADAVAFGRYFISNPDLVKRFEHNAALTEADQDTFYTPGPKGFTDYPAYDFK